MSLYLCSLTYVRGTKKDLHKASEESTRTAGLRGFFIMNEERKDFRKKFTNRRDSFLFFNAYRKVVKRLNDSQKGQFLWALAEVEFLEKHQDSITFKDVYVQMAWDTISFSLRSQMIGFFNRFSKSYDEHFNREWRDDLDCSVPLKNPSVTPINAAPPHEDKDEHGDEHEHEHEHGDEHVNGYENENENENENNKKFIGKTNIPSKDTEGLLEAQQALDKANQEELNGYSHDLK